MPASSHLIEEIEGELGQSAVLSKASDLKLYEYDGGVDKSEPDLVVFPRSTADVVSLVRAAQKHNVAIVGRGAGTGLSGGAIARAGGMIISFARMNRILEIDIANERAVVQPGVVNLDITLAVQPSGTSLRPILPASAPAPSAATWRRMPAARTRWPMA